VLDHDSASRQTRLFGPGNCAGSSPSSSQARRTTREGLARAAEWNFRLSAFSMHRHHDMALMPLLVLTVIDAAALLNEPFS